MIANNEEISGQRRGVPSLFEDGHSLAKFLEALFGRLAQDDSPVFRLDQHLVAARNDLAVAESAGMLPAPLAGFEIDRRKKSFVVPATIFFLVWYFGFIILAGYAEDFMGREFLTDGLTVGYVLALSQFVMTWVLGWLYLRKADRVFDPLATRAREAVIGTREGRFDRDVAGERAPPGSMSTEEAPR